MYLLENRVMRLIDEIKSLLIVQSKKMDQLEIRRGELSFPCDLTRITDGFKPFQYGELWSEPEFNNYALFRFHVQIPKEYDNQRVVLHVTTNQSAGNNMIRPQMLLFVDGKPTQGLDTNHEHVLLSDQAKAGQTYFIHIYAFSGISGKMPYGSLVELNEREGVRLYVDLQTENDELTDYYYNLNTPFAYLKYFEKSSYEYQTILRFLNDSLSELDLREPYSAAFYKGVRKANELLQETLYSGKYKGMGSATLVGHTYIDLAWLWQYKHTRDKVGRSFSTAVKLLGEQETYRFMSSQAQLYEYVKDTLPELYQKIRELVKQERWEAEGAMWVEPDMNLCSGESIVRQILYGKKFFQQEFDVDCKVLWLPDVFGYSAALPQILKKAGVDYFMTAKIGTNELNRFPYDTFLWKGIDGTVIFSHLISYLNGYNPDVENGDILPGWRNYTQKDINEDILVPFGFSDGGGGPTEEQIEAIKRLENGLPGIPKTKFGTVRDYFNSLEKRVIEERRLPVWVGEIYYERHRGTYTSMARVKRQNRKCEFLYINAEWLWSLARLFGGGEFPKKCFDRGMKNMLLNQFHDVLPGSAIREVYEDSDALYREAVEIGEEICRTAVQTLTRQIGAEEDSMLVFNPHGETMDGYVDWGGEARFVKNVPAKGFAVYSVKAEVPDEPVRATVNQMENQYYLLTFSEDGSIESLYDKKAGRQCFIPGQKANRLRIFEDKPGHENGYREDNWNLDCYYTEREYEIPKPLEVTVLESGGERGIVRMIRQYQSSRIKQDIIFYARSPRIDFQTEIDWKEHSQVLRVEFPVDVNAVRATYEIQFGHLERTNTRNTSWDDAKFEVCGHKWADISDGGYGMALLNDCKYGYSAEGSILGLTLLRCGNMPNPEADKELHRFTYSILMHQREAEAEIIKQAYLLNNPIFAVKVGKNTPAKIQDHFSLFECRGAVLETVKPAEDGDGLILRMYEPHNCSAQVRIVSGCPVKSVELCDLLERTIENGTQLNDNGEQNTISLPIKPFEIVTLRVRLCGFKD